MTKSEKTIVYFTIGLVLFLIYLIVFSNNGFIDYQQIRKKELSVERITQKVEMENTKLENEIQSLKTDEAYIKHIAKHEHEMAEQEELIFKLRKEKEE